jgi:hypothetical protein
MFFRASSIYLLNAVVPSLLAIAGLLAAPAKAEILLEATASARVEQRQQQVRQVRPDNYDLSRHPFSESAHWRNILWTTAVVEPQEAYVATAIAQLLGFANQPNLPDAHQETVKMALQVGTQLYISNSTLYAPVGQQFLQIVERSPNPEWVAMSLSVLSKGLSPEQRQQLSDRTIQRFPDWQQNVHLYTTIRDIAEMNSPSTLPPVADLLNWTIAPGQLQAYVLCRPNRGVLCQMVLKDRNGNFVRQGDELWTVPLLLRSLHELSWNFTRGQTPQGIYRVEGTRLADPNTFQAYGAFSLVKLFLPYEEGVQEFLPGQGAAWSGGVAAYQALLPPSWRNYYPIQQSYWAGKAGRSFFRIHGSGQAVDFFTNNRRYPAVTGWNPTIGCLSAIEQYDDAGRLQQADMPKILQALTTLGGQSFTGYLFVIEIPGSDTPLSVEEIEQAIGTR